VSHVEVELAFKSVLQQQKMNAILRTPSASIHFSRQGGRTYD
jgi:hypothetical protein